MMTFDWDARKNGSNEKKHGISFDEAQSVFYDDNARLIYDSDHSDSEDRFVLQYTIWSSYHEKKL